MNSLFTVPNDDSGILSVFPTAQLFSANTFESQCLSDMVDSSDGRRHSDVRIGVVTDNDTPVSVGQGSASRLTAWRNTCCESALGVVSDDDVRQHHHFGPHEEDDEQRDHSKHQAH